MTTRTLPGLTTLLAGEASKYLNISKPTLYRLRESSDKDLQGIRYGAKGRGRWPVCDLDAFLNRRRGQRQTRENGRITTIQPSLVVTELVPVTEITSEMVAESNRLFPPSDDWRDVPEYQITHLPS